MDLSQSVFVTAALSLPVVTLIALVRAVFQFMLGLFAFGGYRYIWKIGLRKIPFNDTWETHLLLVTRCALVKPVPNAQAAQLLT